MKLLLKRSHLIIVIVAAILFIVIKSTSDFYGSPVSTLTNGTQSDEATPVNKNLLPVTHNEQQQVSNNNLPATESVTSEKYSSEYKWPTVSGSPADQEEMNQWSYARGFTLMLPGKQSDYEGYTNEILKTLANEGDIHAMQTLAARIGGAQGVALLKLAAAHGSTMALLSMAIDVASNYEVAELNGAPLPDEEKRKLQVESKAYYEAIGLRGDEEFRRSGDRHFADEKVEFTQAEQHYIKERAKAIYDELQQQRTELGLGEFDNSVPDSVKKYLATFEKPTIKTFCDFPENQVECEKLLAEYNK